MIRIYSVWENEQLLCQFTKLELADLFGKEYTQLVLKAGYTVGKIRISCEMLDVISDHREVDELLSTIKDTFSSNRPILPDIPPLAVLKQEV